MIHIKDSPLPMGKVWFLDSLSRVFFATLQVGWVEPLWMFENRQGTDPNGPVERPPPFGKKRQCFLWNGEISSRVIGGWLGKKKHSLYRGLPSLKLTAKSPENRPSQKGNTSSNHPFLEAMLGSGRVYHQGKKKTLFMRPFIIIYSWLVVEPTPFEKYARQIGNLPQIGMNIKNV